MSFFMALCNVRDEREPAQVVKVEIMRTGSMRSRRQVVFVQQDY